MGGQEWTRPVTPACARCFHSSESHIHDSPLSCALGPLAHAMGVGCSLYTPRTVPYSGANCREPGCECAGYYSDARPRGGPVGTSVQELLRGGGRQ